jgi:F-type H+-transporting ATPase subunit a
MHEHELWFTALLNRFLPGPAWTNYNAMLLLAALFLVVSTALIRRSFSVDRPGYVQQSIEGIYEFLGDLAQDIVGHNWRQHFAWFCTLFFLILTCNLMGLIPTLESPTMFFSVSAGMALCSFLYYQGQGIKEQGILGHLKHFAGPVLFLAPFMFILELISHSIRPVSLTIRLTANMIAGEQVTVGVLALAPWLWPVLVMALHLLVSLLQAFIFTVLSMAYVGEAVAHESH